MGSQSSSSSQALPSSWGGRGDRDLHPCLHMGTETPRVPITQPQTRARPRHRLAPGGPCSSTLIRGARGDGQHPNVLSVFPSLAGHGDTCWLRPALDQPEWWAHTEVGMRPCDRKGQAGTPAQRVGRRRGWGERVKRRGRSAGSVTPACAPGSHPGYPTSDKASEGLPGPPPGQEGMKQGAHGVAGVPRGGSCCSVQAFMERVWEGGSADHRRYAFDTRERRVGQTHVCGTPACTAAGHTRFTGSGVEAGVRVRGRLCARHVWVKPARTQET